ncbi:hypothetical protein [uncultured Rhodoblastus sp.]|uniref:hypothetical protein n=1 Tax=uncultured Rhodoblastus sp. TaxID=543037 RepID=UPI0025D15F3D|nr:hypothetical protein [uncultured Rhodoblastus sp.]
MAKKSKVRRLQNAPAAPAKTPGSIANRGLSKKRTAATKGAAAKNKTGAPAAKSAGRAKSALASSAVDRKSAGKRPSGRIALTAPLARARKLSGDLYQAASLAIWAEAVDAAPVPDRAALIELQDAICDAGDLLRDAWATNPKHLMLYWVACFDREGLPVTPPRFITATDGDEALKIFHAAFKGEFGRRKPRAYPVPALAEKPTLHDR